MKSGTCLAGLLFVSALLLAPSRAAEPVSYNRHIRPLLSDNCFACHGPDESHRKAKLRLDIRASALEKGVIVPGEPAESELMKRILSHDPDEIMPPPDSAKVLSDADKELFQRWIAEGAVYETHWAYVPPVKAPAPSGSKAIDHLVQKRLEEADLEPSPKADRRILARRLYFDLIGLPPTPEEVKAFERDTSPRAYENLVEQLLSSPHYGERMAIGWLDIVRFADTIGYHSDNPRNIWPYRDYVINAFNENKPFDEFTIEQIAGDLLPGATVEQKVASAFNRLLLTTEEGGAQPKDYEARMLTDRVRAIGAVWLGQTIGCAQCHDHKFDPITSRDFYSMGAFFADIKEPIIGRREPGMIVPNEEQAAELARLDAEIKRLQAQYDGPHEKIEEGFAEWRAAESSRIESERSWKTLHPAEAKSAGGASLEAAENGAILAKGSKPDKDSYTLRFEDLPNPISALRIEALPHDSLRADGPGRASNGNFVVTEVLAAIHREDGRSEPVEFAAARADFEQGAGKENPYGAWVAAAAIDEDAKGDGFGWAILPQAGEGHYLVLELARPAVLAEGDSLELEIQQNHGKGSHTLGHFRITGTSSYDAARGFVRMPLAGGLEEILIAGFDKASAKEKASLLDYYKTIAPELEPLRAELAATRKARAEFEASLPRCLVSVSMDEPRTVRILPRGNWMNEGGEIVQPALPGYLPAPVSSENGPLNRLDLAKWLVWRGNPLTARVIMNRLWQQFFGIGLSKVLADLGAQGEPPPNQALLDWLAVEFMESGWDMKHMVRLIVNSHTYKQVSTPSPEALEIDPYNRLLASQSRWRLDAELVRDNALAISGLLVPKIGGPSVKPYQPAGYWENLNFPPRTYQHSTGEDQYRRGLYTWWQRSFLHPSLLAFDAPSREECTAERNRSNIPQQALVLLNDPTYVEASRAFAARILRGGGKSIDERLAWAWRAALCRDPRPDELQTMRALVEKHLAEYRQDTAAAKALLEVGLKPVPEGLDPAELAAWSNAARVILNLHETITRS